MSVTLEQRDERQRDLVPSEALAGCRCTVVGVGAIGRQVALQLAALGVARLQLVDPDVVEVVNLGPQAYLERDVGRLKVDATAELCHQLHGQIGIETAQGRFRRSMHIEPIIFACVDSIAVRRHIHEAVRPGAAADRRPHARRGDPHTRRRPARHHRTLQQNAVRARAGVRRQAAPRDRRSTQPTSPPP